MSFCHHGEKGCLISPQKAFSTLPFLLAWASLKFSCLHKSLLPESLSLAFSIGFRGLSLVIPQGACFLFEAEEYHLHHWSTCNSPFFCWYNGIHEPGLIIKALGVSGNRYWESKKFKVRRPSLARTYGASLCHREQKGKGTWTEERKQSSTPTTINTFKSLSSILVTQSSPTGLWFNAASMGPQLSTSFDEKQPDFSRAARLENSL